MNSPLVHDFIAGHFLLQTFPPERQQKLIKQCQLIRLKNNEALFHQGDVATRFYIVMRGSMKLFRLSAGGHTKIIEVVHQGDPFAEALMFMEQKAYPLNAAAVGEAEVIAIPNELYKSALTSDPQVSLSLLGTMAVKLHRRINEIEILTLQNTRHRLGNYLFNLAPDPAAKRCVVRLPMAKQLIASQLGMQPETFSRMMKEMRTQALIEVNGVEIKVNDLQGLRQFGY